MKRKLFSILALLFAVSTAWADNVNYFDPTAGVGQQTKTATNPTAINDGTTTLGTANTETWYYVSGTFTNGNRIEVSGTVNIILVDGCNFTASKGIKVESPNALNIWAQKAGNGCGALTVRHEGKNAAIGGDGGPSAYGNGPYIYDNPWDPVYVPNPDAANASDAGTITIYGGDITAHGNIGGGDGGDGYDLGERSGIGGKGGNGTIIIYDGHITVHNNLGGNLGGGKGGYGHGVPMYSGDYDEYGDPIVSSYDGGEGGDGGTGTVTINGGYVNSEYMGGGYYGDGNGQSGSFGLGNVSLSWSKASDMIYSQSYIGTVHLVKSFMDMHEVVYEGDYEDCQKGTIIQHKWLYPYSTMYDITIGGSYDPECLQSSKAHAMEGAEITLTAINGYKVSSLTVKDAENQDVSLTDNLNGTWTFIMPAKAVSITPVATRFYQVTSSSNISHDVANANDKMVQNSKTYYRPGATVNLEVTVSDGYVIQSLTVKDEDDQNVSYSANGTNAYTFTMPTKAVTMEAVTMRDFSGLTLIEGTAAFTVTAGTEDDYRFRPENLLDGKYSSTDPNNYSLWIVNDIYNYGESSGCYVEFNTAAPVIPKHYTLISSNNPWEAQGCYPTSWTIKAKASSGGEWTTIATESDNYTMNDEEAYHSYLFDFDNPGNNAYKYFRFEVTTVEGWTEWGDEYSPTVYHNWLELSEMQMYVKGETLETLAAHSDDNGNYWATYYNGTKSFAADFNTTIYKGAVSDNKVLLTAVDDIPSGNAVILKSTAPTIMLIQTPKSTDFSDNDLLGTDTEIVPPANTYCMAKGATGVGFYKYSSANGNIPAKRAYLIIPGGGSNAPVRKFYKFSDDNGEVTGIDSLTSDPIPLTSDNWYDLQGRKVDEPTKGMYIVNGKIVIIK